MSGCDATAMGA